MKKLSTLFAMLVLWLAAVPALAQLTEIKGKGVSVNGPATQIEEGKWYVMQNGGRKAYAYSTGVGETLMSASTSSVKIQGSLAADIAGYLVRFSPVEGVEGAYTIQTGLGDYWGELTTGSNSGTVESDPMYYTAGKMEGLDDWFWFKGNNGEMQLDCNDAGYSVAGWTDMPTSTSSNAAWQIVSVELVDARTRITATINYTYKVGDETVYTYTDKQVGFVNLEVEFAAPATYVGASSTDTAPANETITASKTYEVTYNYTIDTSALPFSLATVEDGKFAADTKWYYLQPMSTHHYVTATDNDGSITYGYKNFPLKKLNSFFTFTGNPISGFKIHNYTKAPNLSICGPDDNSATYFAEENTTFVLEEGEYDGEYRFRLSSSDIGYLNAYGGALEVYENEGAYNDAGSQYYITEIPQTTIDRAIQGVIEVYAALPESGTVFRDGAVLEKITLGFTEEIALPTERIDIVLQDYDGNTVATPTCTIDPSAPDILLLTFDPAISEEGNYKLYVPEGAVVGATTGNPCVDELFLYAVMGDFTARTVTAHVTKSYTDADGSVYTNWPQLPYEDGQDYYKIKVRLDTQDDITLLDWENTGNEGNDIHFVFNPASSYGLTINGDDGGSYGYLWVSTKYLTDDGCSGCYMYPGSSTCQMDAEKGAVQICCYSFDTGGYYYITAEWYMDDRYAGETLTGKVYNEPITDDLAGEVAWTQLPYGSDGTYNIDVVMVNDSTITLKNFTGASGEDKTIVFDPETGDVVTINGQEPDEYGTVFCKSTVLDGTSAAGYYEYTGNYSHVEYDAETRTGKVWLLGVDFSEDTVNGDYRYLFITFSDEAPQYTVLPGKIYKDIPEEYGDCTSWPQLPYNDEGVVEMQVRVNSDTSFTLLNYTGANENLTITFDPETHYVTSINGAAMSSDSYYTWVSSSVLESGYWAYGSEYSLVYYNPETQSGSMLLSGYGNETGYADIYLTFGDGETGIACPKTPGTEKALNVLYDLAGRKLSTKPAKGVIITNGKKLLVK